MDRTIIAPWKAEEKELSEKLYRKLQGLAMLYPINDEFRKLLSWDMFLKPNQPAFFQVMHFLFRVLDAQEFKKRFFWPITDKRSEANFRSSTVEYLKYLNGKHHLQWANIKSYLVVMPGGMKFITFMLDFVSFVVQELIKQREKSLLGNDGEVKNVKELNFKRMSRQNAFLKEYASAYLYDVEEHVGELRKRTLKIKESLSEIAKECGTSIEQLMDDKFLHDFNESNRKLCEEKIILPAENIATLESISANLRDNIQKFLTKEAQNNYSKEALNSALRIIQDYSGESFINSFSCDGSIKINNLLQAFCCISDTINEQLATNDQYNSSSEFVTSELEAIKLDIQQYESQITEVQRTLHSKTKQRVTNELHLSEALTPFKGQLSGHCNTDNPLMMKFVSTPPIKLDFAPSDSNASVRLPLQDDFNITKPFDAYGNMLAPTVPRSARKVKPVDVSVGTDSNTTMNRSKIVDSTQLLRTINKDTSKAKTQHNLSSLGSKWKQRQGLLGIELDLVSPTKPVTTNQTNLNALTTTLIQSPYTPFGSNELTRIERGAHNESSNSLLYSKKSAVMKVLDASLNVQNLSTSPSGRLEPLIPETELPKVQINDKTLNEMEHQIKETDVLIDENNLNVLNIMPAFEFESICDNDSLNNISDSVLNDVFI